MMKNLTLIYQAKSFYNAYIALEQLKPDDEFLLFVPRLVNGAFSVELVIKAILTEKNISYDKVHNLKILFDKLPLDIQNKIWECLAEKAPEYSDAAKRETELLLISEAFEQCRYCFKGNITAAFDVRFLSAFANACISVMFALGYNSFITERTVSPEDFAEIDAKIENNRNESIKRIQKIIQNKKGGKKQ